MKFSNGWLFSFKKRNGFKRFKSHGESASTNVNIIAQELPILREELSHYHLNDIWNADEFGLFYSMAPDTAIGPGPVPGQKKKKDQLTFLACGNADGTEMLPTIVIGKSKKPKCFDGKEASDHGFNYYYNNKKGWMNQVIFFDWLLKFDAYISQTRDRKVQLLVNNASSHGNVQTLPTCKVCA